MGDERGELYEGLMPSRGEAGCGFELMTGVASVSVRSSFAGRTNGRSGRRERDDGREGRDRRRRRTYRIGLTGS